MLISQGRALGLFSQAQCLAFLGSRFRVAVVSDDAELTDEEVGRLFLQRHICVHTEAFEEKFDTLLVMLEKLYAAVHGQCELDNLDSPANQEVLLAGHLYLQVFMERLEDLLTVGIRPRVLRDLKRENFDSAKFRDINYLKGLVEKQTPIGRRLEHFLATGTLVSKSNLDLMQTTGFTIVADKLNNTRYLSHFRSIHRGQYFTQQRTTQVRKLLPEAWGFLCPVHTPDGSPCGLLNHIAKECHPVAGEEEEGVEEGEQPEGDEEPRRFNRNEFKQLLCSLGMSASGTDLQLVYSPEEHLPVLVDGVLLGYVTLARVDRFVAALRYLKVTQENSLGENKGAFVPRKLEVAFISPPRDASGALSVQKCF